MSLRLEHKKNSVLINFYNGEQHYKTNVRSDDEFVVKYCSRNLFKFADLVSNYIIVDKVDYYELWIYQPVSHKFFLYPDDFVIVHSETIQEPSEVFVSNFQIMKKLDLLMKTFQNDFSDMSRDTKEMKKEFTDMKKEITDMKKNFSDMKKEIEEFKRENVDLKKKLADGFCSQKAMIMAVEKKIESIKTESVFKQNDKVFAEIKEQLKGSVNFSQEFNQKFEEKINSSLSKLESEHKKSILEYTSKMSFPVLKKISEEVTMQTQIMLNNNCHIDFEKEFIKIGNSIIRLEEKLRRADESEKKVDKIYEIFLPVISQILNQCQRNSLDLRKIRDFNEGEILYKKMYPELKEINLTVQRVNSKILKNYYFENYN